MSSSGESPDVPTAAPAPSGQFHEPLIDAARRLEAALAAAAPGREAAWQQRVAVELKAFHAVLADHVASTESSSGLLGDVEKVEPAFHHRVLRLVREHADLLSQTRSLTEHLAAPFDVHDVRQRAGWLLTAFRHHQALEADLVFELFELDLGAGD